MVTHTQQASRTIETKVTLANPNADPNPNLNTPRSGRVTEWLGPSYFNEEVPIVAGCPVRIMRDKDPAAFRNTYKYSNMVRGTVTVVGADYSEVSVEESFGLKVTLNP